MGLRGHRNDVGSVHPELAQDDGRGLRECPRVGGRGTLSRPLPVTHASSRERNEAGFWRSVGASCSLWWEWRVTPPPHSGYTQRTRHHHHHHPHHQHHHQELFLYLHSGKLSFVVAEQAATFQIIIIIPLSNAHQIQFKDSPQTTHSYQTVLVYWCLAFCAFSCKTGTRF